MKLYTEEQLKEAFNCGRLYLGREGDTNFYHLIDKLIPIELPSDEEVEKMRKEYIEHINTIVHRDLERDGYLDLGFLAGAKNIIYKIQGGNK